jgi:co-chaperonin GroES (HSP10)
MTTIEQTFILGGEHYDVHPTRRDVVPTIEPADSPAPEATDEQKASSMPDPSGFKLLCMVPDVAQKFEGTELLRPDALMKAEEHGTTVLFVLKAGPDAYKDQSRYPSGPWCKPGDFVLVRTYSGTRFKIYGKEFRLINEDQVEAVVADPRGITRA